MLDITLKAIGRFDYNSSIITLHVLVASSSIQGAAVPKVAYFVAGGGILSANVSTGDAVKRGVLLIRLFLRSHSCLALCGSSSCASSGN